LSRAVRAAIALACVAGLSGCTSAPPLAQPEAGTLAGWLGSAVDRPAPPLRRCDAEFCFGQPCLDHRGCEGEDCVCLRVGPSPSVGRCVILDDGEDEG